jgi:DNA-directed RNA polymerase 1, mitochondrial|nr:MAG TPA: DNA directed RNA polymerase [Caudoviricetes sp.]
MTLEQRQLNLELEGINEGIAKIKADITKAKANGGYGETKVSSVLIYQLMQPFMKGIIAFKNSRIVSHNDKFIKDFLERVGYSEAGYITLRTVINNICLNELKPVAISKAITKALLSEINIKNYKAVNNQISLTADFYIKGQLQKNVNRARIAAGFHRFMDTTDGFEREIMSAEEQLLIGKKLVDILIEATGLFELSRSSVRFGKSSYILTLSKAFREHLTKIEGECELLTPILYPMLVKPIPHEAGKLGGFLTPVLQVPLVKNLSGTPNDYLKDHEMPKVYRAINALQDTAWCINKRVLEVAQHFIELDKEIPELDITSGSELDFVPRPAELPVDATNEEYAHFKTTYPEIHAEWKKASRTAYRKQISDRGKRLLLVSQLATAMKFKDEPELYYCYNLDWRGRIYPLQSGGCPNPQGNDLSKALLKFANGVALGAEGAKWLSMLGANTFGDDKLPMSERWAWAKAHEKDILMVAKDPYANTWWFEADEPFKFLAFCFEWSDYVASGYSSEFISYLPVPLDGSCSGIQHFSALLLDERGALATNVINGDEDKPSDIYAEVAKEVSKAVEIDAANGVLEAKPLVGKVDRSVTKRNTMTTPYGVSRDGMKEQLLTELNPKDYTFVDTSFARMCVYLAERNKEGIEKVVVASKNAMDFLKEIARVANKEDKAIFWTTPSGFLVRQRYLKFASKRVDTFWGGTRIRLNVGEETSKIDHTKTVNGQSPNYVHSMDASHLVLTVDACLDKGVENFGMIHDSFATHAGNTDKLRDTLREEFVKMYSENQLARFRDEIASQLSPKNAKKLPELPKQGNLDITKVLNSTYFFS